MDLNLINISIHYILPGETANYKSIDTVIDQDEAKKYPSEFLNSLDLSGLPSHIINMKGSVQSGGASVIVWDVYSWRDMGPLIRLQTTLTCDRDVNIIEDIQDALLHAVENRTPPPRVPMDLWTVLKDEWCELPPRYLQTVVESMPHRVAALLRVRGGPTRYLAGVPVFLALQCYWSHVAKAICRYYLY
ncbi:hypothetical protein AVEN_158822-1 [Araneus ventricosus]|uniref:Uncharacterized protein n=1 Tax=Araneus ventricosus TaxID=182803 RepID=A0A4Y2RTH0_ARAVE|nr:hypothetical protein AVEN_209075-1 [Araneus ventricosus]GBN78489.1 hypothetical protein AVEN_70027-1 [Araneus ventricosus]GBN79013.1 hypothetical protein AVEN_75331-1 [Araneus ventricosus]GBN79014.1 hypothetical protein AVEN_158822-1 [Araneus ventricosus]